LVRVHNLPSAFTLAIAMATACADWELCTSQEQVTEVCDIAAEKARRQGDLVGIVAYSYVPFWRGMLTTHSEKTRWLALVPVCANIEIRTPEGKWCRLKRSNYCLDRWESSVGVGGDQAYYMAEKYRDGGEFLFVCRDSPSATGDAVADQCLNEEGDLAQFPDQCHLAFQDKELTINRMKTMCVVTGVTFDGNHATILVSTLGDTFEIKTDRQSSWGMVRKDICSKRGRQCHLFGPDGEFLNCADLVDSCSFKLGGA